jgi:predicted thioredoxin/glutaredoxin
MENPFQIINYKAWSVPWIIVDGQAAATDPVEYPELEAIIENRELVVRDPLEAFKNTIIHSGYLSSIVALWGSIDPVLNNEVISVAIREPITKIDVEYVKERIVEKKEEIYREIIDVVYRTLGIAFVRELLWASRGELTEDDLTKYVDPLIVKTWLIAKASIGRIGLPRDPWNRGGESAEAISNFISRSARGILNKVRREYEEITSDEDYWRVIREISDQV